MGFLVFVAGVVLAERQSGFSSESEPLSHEEEVLVRTILGRRMGGDMGGD